MDISNYTIILAFGVGVSLGYILGLLTANFIRRTSLMPLLNGIIVVVFLSINIFGVIYSREIPYIFNFTLAITFGLVCGVDIVKYLKFIPGKKE